MSRVFTATAETTLSAAGDVLEINAPSTGVVMITSITLTQSTEEGDAESEMLPLVLARAATSGSGGSSATPQAHDPGDASADATVEVANTTPAGTQTAVRRESFNVQAGFFHTPIPEERIVLGPSDIFVVALDAAPADPITFQVAITFAEIGG